MDLESKKIWLLQCVAWSVVLYCQGRLFSYSDTHRHRLGPNYHQIPVNCPFNTRVNNYQRDGPGCIDGNHGQSVSQSVLPLFRVYAVHCWVMAVPVQQPLDVRGN